MKETKRFNYKRKLRDIEKLFFESHRFKYYLVQFIIDIFTPISCERAAAPLPEITIKDGLIYKQGEPKAYSGVIKSTLEGKIIEYTVVEGKKNGEFKTYFKNGQLEMIGQIKENLNRKGIGLIIIKMVKSNLKVTFKDDLPEGTWKWTMKMDRLKRREFMLKVIARDVG